MLLGFFVGMISGISIPAYQDYMVRSHVVQGLEVATPLKPLIADYVETHSRMPNNINEIFVAPESLTSKYVQKIEIAATEKQKYLKITFKFTPLVGKSINLYPQITGKTIEWRCASDDILRRYLPKECRLAP